MDQVNAFLKVAKRHYFWILTGIVVLGGLGTWFYATGTLRAEYNENKSTIESAKQKINVIRSEANHPNDSSAEQMQARIDAFTLKVRNAWKTLYENQEKNTLVWPEELKPDFISKVKPMRPIEAKIDYPTPPAQSLSSNLTERYQNYIKEELPKLAEIVGAKWQPTAGGGGGGGFGREGGFPSPRGGGEFGGQPGLPLEEEALVNWSPQNQGQIQQERFDWTNKPGGPSTLDVLYAQEDLWVLQTIMRIIARTNGDATAHHRATIKQIESIYMGRNAVGLMGKVQRLEVRSGSEDDFFGGGYSEPVENMTTVPPMERGEGAAPSDPAAYRYVDPQNVPLTAEALRDALRTNSSETAFLSVAKRLPVRIRVIMDQRKIHLLLAECGSAPLTIEVRQVRVNRDAGGGGGGGGFGGGNFGGGREGGGNFGGNSGSNAPDASTTYDVPVEVYGVVYLFNPPNDDILKLSESQLAEATTAATPKPPVAAATPPTTEPAVEVPAEPAPDAEAPAEPAPEVPAPEAEPAADGEPVPAAPDAAAPDAAAAPAAPPAAPPAAN